MRFRKFIAIAAWLISTICLPSAFADDASGISDFQVTKTRTSLHVSAHAADASIWANTQLMIDCDGDAKTGYHLADPPTNGFDVMVEGTTVYRFHGTDGSAWAWDKVGQATRKVADANLSIDIKLDVLKLAPSATGAAVLRTLSPDYQKVLATSSSATIDPGSAASPMPAVTTAPAATNAFGINAKQDGPELVLQVTAKTATDFNTVLIFFDTDSNADTGFQPPADPHFGFEDMIQGGSLSKHTGDARGGWSWLTLAPVKQTITGNTAEIRFNASLLKSTSFDLAAWQMSADWQMRTDRFPAEDPGTIKVKLDPAKLHADATDLAVPMAPRHANADLPARERLKEAKSYCCYYGPERADALSHFDAAILHIPAQTPANVKTLSQLGVVTIGYLSVGEDEALRVGNGHGPGGKASWYFDRKHTGKPEENGTWSSYFANAADPAWRADRVEQAKRLCGTGDGEWGFDGIFLDTIETVDAYPESRDGMIKLVAELRAALPDKVIVINRGFSLLGEDAVSSKIDGLMFESFSDSYDFDTKQYMHFSPQDLDSTRSTMTSIVQPAMKKYGLRVLALDYVEPDQTATIQAAFDRAATFDMIPAVSLISLDSVYNTFNVVGHANPKYLQKMATPQSLQVKLNAECNGFPAGTILQPSSCYMGYSAAAVVDGVRDRSTLSWSKAAWASAEEAGTSHELLMQFPQPIAGGTLKITFAVDGGRPYVSKNFHVEARRGNDDPWQTIAQPTKQHDLTFQCPLPAQPVSSLRIVQDPSGGSEGRPNIMWIGQIERVVS